MRFFLVATLLIGSFAVAAATGRAAEAGDLVKCSDFTSVYLLKDDGKRWVFPNEKTYFTWYNDFNSVVEISCEDLAGYMIGGNVTYKPGSRLLKLISAPTVYSVSDGGVLRAVPSEASARSLYGDAWADFVDDLADTFWSSYDVGDPLADTAESEEASDEAVVAIIEPELTYSGAYNGTLYATSEQIGSSTPIADYMDNLDRNGVTWLLPFFTFEDAPDADTLVVSDGFGYAVNAVQQYPGRIVPYYNPGFGGAEIEDEGILGDALTTEYETNLAAAIEIIGDGFFHGLGEIETQEWRVAHDSEEVLALFSVADDYGLNAMFHPVASKISQVEEVIEAYPNMTFLIHMYRDDLADAEDELIEILENHDNLFFSIDAAHIAHTGGMDILYDYTSSAGFIAEFDDNYDTMLAAAIRDYRNLVNAVPDKVMWGTEAGPSYAFEPEVYDRLIKISRELIGAMDEEYQEGLAYENAFRVFGEGVTLTETLDVYDTAGWAECPEDDVDGCDAECGITGEDVEDTADETCFQACLIVLQCTDPFEDAE